MTASMPDFFEGDLGFAGFGGGWNYPVTENKATVCFVFAG
jgi:hypothetical protein